MADEPQDTPQDATPASIAAPTQSGQALHLSDATPAPGSTPGKPLEKSGTGKVVVRTRYPVDRFEHNVKGVEPITSAGVEVDRSKAKALLDAAAETGTELEEVENA